MDVLPAHLNRDSFRNSFKGLVALEIIFDLPFGFPINNIISLNHSFGYPINNIMSLTDRKREGRTQSRGGKRELRERERERTPDVTVWAMRIDSGHGFCSSLRAPGAPRPASSSPAVCKGRLIKPRCRARRISSCDLLCQACLASAAPGRKFSG